MGCTQSKIENEEAVSRCKERKMHMKEAVVSRNLFAAAHSAYTMALKNTGAALSDYGPGEVQEYHGSAPAATPQNPRDTLPPPPPPLPDFPPIPLARSISMPEIPGSKSDPKPAETIVEEEDVEEEEDAAEPAEPEPEPTTPTSPPPPPPLSRPQPNPVDPPPAHLDSRNETWDFFFPGMDGMHVPSLTPIEEVPPSPPPVQEESNIYREEKLKRRDGDRADGSKSRSKDSVERTLEKVVVEPPQKTIKKQGSSNGGASTSSSMTASEGSKRGKGASSSNTSLMQILNELDDHFLKASESAHEVSKMLEANRMHYHSNFADNRGHIDHSARVMRVITWNKSFKNIPNADDGKDDFDADEYETHATILDKLLAWEKKLYDEVKAGELMKLEYQRKVTLLNKQKKRASNPDSLEKTKAAVSHLHTRYIVDMQSMDSTVSEIHRLRDDQLFPKLVALVSGMAKMWETMHMHHDRQQKIVADLRGLDISNAPKETSKQHHDRTRQLCRILGEWNSQFQKLMYHQKEYIDALHSWLKLTLIPIESSLREKVSSPPRVPRPPIQFLLQSWHDVLEKLPVELAKGAISSFDAVMKTILSHQEDELKQKVRCEEADMEYKRKLRAFEVWRDKYEQRRLPASAADDTEPDRTDADTNTQNPVAERQFLVDSLKKKLDDETETYQKLCKHVREKSLGSLKTHLPELFRAMSEFTYVCSATFKRLQDIAQDNATGTPD